MARYSTLRSTDSTSVYIDETDRKDLPGRPQFGIIDWVTLIIIYILWVISLPVTWCCSFKIIPQFERVIVFRLGRILPLKGPGLISIIPCIDTLKRVNMRTRAFKVPPQQILTVDQGVLNVGADVQYRFVDPILAQIIQDLDHTLRVTGQASLNSLLCCEKLKYIQSEKQYLQQRLQAHMNKIVTGWGIEISRIELEHSTVLKGAGGIDPNQPEVDGGAMIMDLLKSVTGQSGSSMPISGMMMPGMFGGGGNNALPSQISSQQQNVQALSPRELFCIAKGVINEGLCQQVAAMFEFHVTSESGEMNIWTADLKNSPGFIMEGTSPSTVDVAFHLDSKTFQKMFYGQLSPTNAYMDGSLVVNGSINTAMKLEILVQKLKAV